MSARVSGSQILAQAVQKLADADVPDAARDARRLLSFVMGVEAGRLTLVLPEPITDQVVSIYRALIARRVQREPVSHITGERQFYGRAFKVTPDVLDPRPETETLIEAALSEPYETVLDLGVGSGCILLTLVAESEGVRGIGAEISDAALVVADENAQALGVSDKIELVRSHWFENVSGQFDLIVSNPPYIADYEMDDLAPEVRDHEPRIALTDEADGLEAYRAILSGAASYLAPEGRLLLEIGFDQAQDVYKIAEGEGFHPVATLKDMDRRDRVIVLKSPASSLASA